ncbi:hypothetical protein Scep_029237 [Stephania cephalantha]|uniref:Uncharacterized protein n=1 Tax=Stephania cephalantha TaxID=152367 RepID=A0AAP0DXB7_9MAGN
MAKQYCEDSDGRSSAPVPIIGLYIAGASLVCLLLMLWDIYVAFRRKHFYIPCRRFKLNSVTLTLLAIVAKLPIDLTTNMPSAADQLSKLTGTTMICICIGFMAPSLVSSKESESKANVASLGIFIVTVVVNICVQMRTGDIKKYYAKEMKDDELVQRAIEVCVDNMNMKRSYELVHDELLDVESKVVCEFIERGPYMNETIDAFV